MKPVIDKIFELIENEKPAENKQAQIEKIFKLENDFKNNLTNEEFDKYAKLSEAVDLLNYLELKHAIEFTYNFCKELFMPKD